MLKIGDKVKVKEDLKKGRGLYHEYHSPQGVLDCCGKIATIQNIYNGYYKLDVDNGEFDWSDDMLDKFRDKIKDMGKINEFKFKAFNNRDNKFYDITSMDFENRHLVIFDKMNNKRYDKHFNNVEIMQEVGIKNKLQEFTKKHDDYKKHILKKLDEVKNLIETEQYEQVKGLTFYSEVNHGWKIVNFAINPCEESENLTGVTDMLIKFKQVINACKNEEI